jgi:hypothetical protein
MPVSLYPTLQVTFFSIQQPATCILEIHVFVEPSPECIVTCQHVAGGRDGKQTSAHAEWRHTAPVEGMSRDICWRGSYATRRDDVTQ